MRAWHARRCMRVCVHVSVWLHRHVYIVHAWMSRAGIEKIKLEATEWMYWYTSSSDSKSSGGEWHRFDGPLSLSHFADLSNCPRHCSFSFFLSLFLFLFFPRFLFALFFVLRFFASPSRPFSLSLRLSISFLLLFLSLCLVFQYFSIYFFPFRFFFSSFYKQHSPRRLRSALLSIAPILFVTPSRKFVEIHVHIEPSFLHLVRRTRVFQCNTAISLYLAVQTGSRYVPHFLSRAF